MDLIDCGKVSFASGTSLSLSPTRLDKFYEEIDKYKNKIVLRPQEISNHPEIIRRLGLIAINTAVEVDIYGNVNSTNTVGSRMINGIGGSGDFARNSYISIFTTQSVIKDGNISCIVPMVSHCDHTEHDVDVIITEQGVADLRGLSPVERARKIIENCAHPAYKEQLFQYLEEAINTCPYKHIPHMLDKAFSWHERLLKDGSMKPSREMVTL